MPPPGPPVQQMPSRPVPPAQAPGYILPCLKLHNEYRCHRLLQQQHIEAHHAAVAEGQQKTRGAIKQIRKTERDAMKNFGSKAAMVANP